MGKRGMSAEEKKVKMKGLLQDSKQPFTLKQLEKMGSKEGVTHMAIKGVLEELCADGVVNVDKIGSTNWFWSFPSQETASLQGKLTQVQAEVKAMDAEIAKLEAERDTLLKDRSPSEERKAKLAELKAEREKLAADTAKLNELKANDPDKIIEIVKQVDTCKAAANHWTDNTWALADYIKKKFGLPKQEVQKLLGMKDDFDYPEFKPVKKKARKV